MYFIKADSIEKFLYWLWSLKTIIWISWPQKAFPIIADVFDIDMMESGWY